MKLGRGKHTAESARERHRTVAQLEFKLQDQRINLGIFEAENDIRMYGEGLIEYARLIGEWVESATYKDYRWEK